MARTRKPARSSARERRTRHSSKTRESRGRGLLSSDRLKQLYTTMLHCRLIAEEAQQLFKESKAAAGHGAGGQEASEVGALVSLRAQDCVSPRKRNVAAGFILGAPLKQVFACLYSRLENPGSYAMPIPEGRGPLVISGAAAMAARINISTGVALSYKTQKKRGVVVVFSGDDSMALASWSEAVDFAVAHKLPIVHVVQDDLGGESATAVIQSPANTTGNSRIPTLIVDGNDVVAVYRVTQEAIRRAREGHGPTLIQCKTHRWPGYSGFVPAHQPPSTGKHARAHDPIPSMEAYLMQKGLWSEVWKQKLLKAFRRRLDSAVRSAQKEKATRLQMKPR
jgi:TPP-dependent pyruvate/acetoin dehydrogenase alpha subunit